MSRASPSQILLHISPPPLNISETRDVYRALKEFGEVELFKIVRHTSTTNLPAPTAHVIFASQPRNLPRRLTITTTPPPPRPDPFFKNTTPPFFSRKLTLTPLPTNFSHHDHVKKIFRSVAGDGILGLRATVDVPVQAETEEEEDVLADVQNLTAKQKEHEPGQYGRLLRLYAGSFRGIEGIGVGESTLDAVIPGNGSRNRKGNINANADNPTNTSNTNKIQPSAGTQQNSRKPEWLEALKSWQPISKPNTGTPQPPKGLDTRRGFHSPSKPSISQSRSIDRDRVLMQKKRNEAESSLR